MGNNIIAWIEIPVIDFQRAKTFYSTIFDCEIYEQEFNNLTIGFIQSQQLNIPCSIIKGDGYKPSGEGVRIYLSCENIDNFLRLVTEAGGKISEEKKFITEEIGQIASFFDTEGNKLFLFTPNDAYLRNKASKENLVTVFKSGNEALISLVKSILDEANIKYLVKGENLKDLFGFGVIGTGYNPLTGPVEIQVLEENADYASELLKDISENLSEETSTDEDS
ncbi:MAG: putative signal transducing protein [Ignavibacteria bacterium]